MTVSSRVDATSSAAALILRPWSDGDLEALIEAHRDPVMRRWLTLPVDDVREAARWLDLQRHGWQTGERCSFAVCEDPSGTGAGAGPPVGHVVLKRTGTGPESAEVGYWTAALARGRAVAPRALEALTRWACDTFAADGLERLELLHQVDNLASCRVAEKAGYRFQRTLAAQPPFPIDGHLHARQVTADAGTSSAATPSPRNTRET